MKFSESTTTREAEGLVSGRREEKQKRVCGALIVAVATGCIAPGLKTTNKADGSTMLYETAGPMLKGVCK